jgi:hypothetical protein
MTNKDEVVSNVLPNMILLHLDMSETLYSATFRPVDTSLIIITDGIGTWHENILDLQKF